MLNASSSQFEVHPSQLEALLLLRPSALVRFRLPRLSRAKIFLQKQSSEDEVSEAIHALEEHGAGVLERSEGVGGRADCGREHCDGVVVSVELDPPEEDVQDSCNTRQRMKKLWWVSCFVGYSSALNFEGTYLATNTIFSTAYINQILPPLLPHLVLSKPEAR